MQARYNDWRVTGWTRAQIAHDALGVPFRTGATETVVSVEDRGITYEVVMGRHRVGDPVIQELTMRGPELTPELVRTAPISWVRDAALTYLADVERAAMEDRLDGATARALAARGPGEVSVRTGPPDPADFARDWNATAARTPTEDGWLSRRQVLADRYSVSVPTVDKWARRARDAGLIGKSKPGRPRKTEDTTEPEPNTTEGTDR